MRKSKLSTLIFMALCCVLGLITKKLVNPFANIVTEALHIPGGVSTGFSIMFMVIAKEVVCTKFGGTMMGTVQGFLALALGRIGSMGFFTPIGYIVPGVMIDLSYVLGKYFKWKQVERMVFTNSLAALMASVTANVLVFHLRGPVVWLYFCVSATSGALYGFLGTIVASRLSIVRREYQMDGKEEKR